MNPLVVASKRRVPVQQQVRFGVAYTQSQQDQALKELLDLLEMTLQEPKVSYSLYGQDYALTRKEDYLYASNQDWEYSLKLDSGRVAISSGYTAHYPENYVYTPYFRFISDEKDFKTYDPALVKRARAIFSKGFPVIKLLSLGTLQTVSTDDQKTLKSVPSEQNKTLNHLYEAIAPALKSGGNTPTTDSNGVSRVKRLIGGKAFTLEQVYSPYTYAKGQVYHLKDAAGKTLLTCGLQDNTPQNYMTSRYLSVYSADGGPALFTSFNEEAVKRFLPLLEEAFKVTLLGEKNVSPEKPVKPPEKPVKKDPPAAKPVAVPEATEVAEAVYCPFPTLEEMLAWHNPIWKSQYTMYKALMPPQNPDIGGPAAGKNGPLALSMMLKRAKAIQEGHDGLESHIGTTAALTMKYYQYGMLQAKDVGEFWKVALKWANSINVDDFHELMTNNKLENQLPLSTPYPILALRRLMGEDIPDEELSTETDPTDPMKALRERILQKGFQSANGMLKFLDQNHSAELLKLFKNRENMTLLTDFYSVVELMRKLPPESETLGVSYVKALYGDEVALLKLTDRAIRGDESLLQLLLHIVQKMEDLMDGEDGYSKKNIFPLAQEVRRKQSPFLAELMLLLNHPKLKKDDFLLGTLTSSISSIDRWIVYSLKVKQKMVDIWAKIGVLTHGFKFWKHDSQGGANSLLGQFGFQSEPAAASSGMKKNAFGALYWITRSLQPALTIDAKTTVYFARGYLMVSNPSLGTLLIRNSSQVFGRNLLKQPAYYSESALTPEQVKLMDSEADLETLSFRRILEPTAYKDGRYSAVLAKLVSELETVKTQYADWKLNPQTFDPEDDTRFQGDVGPGMQALYQKLSDMAADNMMGLSEKPLPRLALMPRNLPPNKGYEWTDGDGVVRDSLEVSETILNEIRDRLNGSWSQAKYPQSQWHPFIQAAVDHNGELVLIDG